MIDFQQGDGSISERGFLTGYRRRTRLGFHRQQHTGRNTQCHRFRFMTNIRHKACRLSHLARRHLFHTSPSRHLLLLVWDLPNFRMALVVARCHKCQHLTCLCLTPSGEEVRYTLCKMSMGVIKVNLDYILCFFLPFLLSFCSFFFFSFLVFGRYGRVTLWALCSAIC